MGIKMSLLEIKNLNVVYKSNDKRIRAVNDFSLNVNLQESVGIVGESGSGKTTLIMAMLRLLLQNTVDINGEVLYDGVDLLTLKEEELRKIRWKEISLVFQKSMNSLSPVHKIGKQLIDIYKIHNSKLKQIEVKENILEIFKLVNLSEKIFDCYPHELSGGMMQRVSIVLSLIFYPRLLIFDEATTALDVVNQGQILDEIIKLEEKLKITRILITHDLSVVSTTCKKVAVMYAGCLVEYGDVLNVLVNPKHPYTKDLLNSYPSLTESRKNFIGISGTLPDLSQVNYGCIFANRCKKSKDICFNTKPRIINILGDWKVACHLIQE